MACTHAATRLLAALAIIALAAPARAASEPAAAATCNPPVPHCVACNTTAQPATCRRCEAGYAPDQGVCSPCKVGTYSRTGQKCLACLTGQSTPALGSSACTVCATGYGVRPLTGRCSPCKAGFFSPGGTSDVCQKCHSGTTSEDKASSCHAVDPSARSQALLSVYIDGAACPTDAAMQAVASGALQSLPSSAVVRLLGCRRSSAGSRAAVQLLLDLSRSAASEAASFIAALEEATHDTDATAVFAALPGLRASLEASSLELSRACTANYLPSADGASCECPQGFALDASAGGCGVPQGATALVRIRVPRLSASEPVCLRRCQGGSPGPTPTQCNPAMFATRAVANVVAWPCSSSGGGGGSLDGSLDEAWLLSGSSSLIRSAADPSLCLAVEDTRDALKRSNAMVIACDEASPAQRWSRSPIDGSLWPGSLSSCLVVCNVAAGGCRLWDTSVANVASRGPCNPQQAEGYFEYEAVPAAQQVDPRCKLEFSLTKPSEPSSFGLSEVVLMDSDGGVIPASELSASQTSTLSWGRQLLSAASCIDGTVSQQPPGICGSDDASRDRAFRLSITYPCWRRLSKVVVHNRGDCCKDLISHFLLHFYGSDGAALHPLYDFATTAAKDTYTIIPDAPREPVCSPLCVHGTCVNGSTGPKCSCEDGWGGPECSRKPDGFICVSVSGQDACGISSTNGVSGDVLCGALVDYEDAASKWTQVSPAGRAFLSASLSGSRLCATTAPDDRENIWCTEDWKSGNTWNLMVGVLTHVSISGTSVIGDNLYQDVYTTSWPVGGRFLWARVPSRKFQRVVIHGTAAAAIGTDNKVYFTDTILQTWHELERNAAMAAPTEVTTSGQHLCVATAAREVWCVPFGGKTWALVAGLSWDFVALGAGDSSSSSSSSSVKLVGLSGGRVKVEDWAPPASPDPVCSSPLCLHGTCTHSKTGPVCSCEEDWTGEGCRDKKIVLSNRQWLLHLYEQATQAEARARCHQEGGELVTIMSREEHELLMAEMQIESIDTGVTMWIGLHSKTGQPTTNKADYAWYGSNTSVPYSAWCGGEPNNYGGKEGVCTIVWNRLADQPRCWNDMPCSYVTAFGCELAL